MINRYQEYTLEKKFVTNNIEFCDKNIFYYDLIFKSKKIFLFIKKISSRIK